MRRLYSKAPIAEAIIDLRVQWPRDAPLSLLESIAASVKDQFPTRNAIHAVHMGVMVPPHADVQLHADQQDVGFRLDTASRNRVLQIQFAGFTYSHLQPYSDWETFRDEALPLWNKYASATGVPQVIRAAVRVINRLPIAGTVGDLPRYCKLELRVPAEAGLAPGAFFAQVQTSADAKVKGCNIIINSGAAPMPDGRFELLLDFDIYCEGQWDTNSPDLWPLLDRLSGIKDEIFEACITDDTRRLIE